jgi:hypothetical protein
MVTKLDVGFPNFRLIREAILSAPPVPAGFPLDALHDVGMRQRLLTAPHLQQYLKETRAEAARAQEFPLEPIPFSLFRLFETTGDRAAFQHVYFDRRRRLAGLLLTTVLDETNTYLETLNDLIWEICNEYTWSLPAHLPVGIEQVRASHVPPEQEVDLFSAHTGHILAETISLLGERLPDWLHYRIRTEIQRRIFQPVFDSLYHFWWESAPMNWASVCGGCVGMTALILIEDRELLAGMIDRVVRTMERSLDGFGADGGCPEGIHYWVYGFGFFTYFTEMLSAFTAGKIDLLQSERVKQIAAFPQVVSLGGERYINFSDVPERAIIHPGLGSRMAALLEQPIPELKPPQFHADHAFRWGHVSRDLLWTEASALEQPVSEGKFYLDNLAWIVDRRVWNGLTVAFAAKGGHNDEPHNHNDLGHFIIHLGDDSLLVDLGAGVYTRQYFQEQRYEFVHTGSHGHSVPLINGQMQREGANHLAALIHHELRVDGLTFALDLTHAYDDPTLETFTRTFDWSVDSVRHTAILQLTDMFRFGSSGGRVDECFVSLIQPKIEIDTIVWIGQHGSVTMPFDPEAYVAEVQIIETKMHYGEPVTVYPLLLCARQPHPSRTDTFVFRCTIIES